MYVALSTILLLKICLFVDFLIFVASYVAELIFQCKEWVGGLCQYNILGLNFLRIVALLLLWYLNIVEELVSENGVPFAVFVLQNFEEKFVEIC